MNFTDLAVLLIIAALVIVAIAYSKNHGCHGSCSTCNAACARRKPGEGEEVPEFVKRYRHDHPKKQSSEIKTPAAIPKTQPEKSAAENRPAPDQSADSSHQEA